MMTWLTKWRTALLAALALPLGVWLALLAIAWARASWSASREWRSLPPSGPGYHTYSMLGAALGRQYVRANTAAVLLDAVAGVHARLPDRELVIAETGWREGGPFWPHQSHQNGRCVDVHVPVFDDEGEPAGLSTAPWFLFGYYWHFDAAAELQGVAWEGGGGCCALGLPWSRRVDFVALAALLEELERAARAHRGRLLRVILTPDYHRALRDVLRSRAVAAALLSQEAWVRHDEHVHVELRF